MENSWTTTQAAKVLQIEVKTLRFWDQSGCLPVPTRQPGQWRKFTLDDLVKVAILDQMVRSGLPVCFACDRLEKSIGTLTVSDFGLAPNPLIGIAWFRGGKLTVAVQYFDGGTTLVLDPLSWSDSTVYSVELVDGVQRPFHFGRVGDYECPKPKGINTISIAEAIEWIKDRLEYYRIVSESGIEEF